MSKAFILSNWLCFLLIFNSGLVSAQEKGDYIWLTGYDNNPAIGIESFCLNFNKNEIIDTCHSNLEFDNNNASICDKDGRLILYTNGCKISNGTHQLVINGDSLNNGPFLQDFWNCDNGYPGIQDILILPDPGDDNGYYIIHKPVDIGIPPDIDISFNKLKYTHVSFENDSTGIVTHKNKTFFSGDFLWSYLTAVPHVNGTDWWIIQPKNNDNVYYVFLLDSSGIKLENEIQIGPSFKEGADAAGVSRFSPDGTKYAYFNVIDGLLLFDFNRNTGSLTNLRSIEPLKEDSLLTGIEFSPNSQYIYISAKDTLWQVDLTVEDLEEGMIFIDEWNGALDPFPTYFHIPQLAPDCKIYINSPSTNRSYHVIKKPNLKGTDCEFVQQGIKLPFLASPANFPNFPRFRVDEDMVCDSTITSIFGEPIFIEKELLVFPNPSSDIVRIQMPENRKGKILMYDSMLREAFITKEVNGESEFEIDVSQYQAGSYYIEYIPDERNSRIIYGSKLIITD